MEAVVSFAERSFYDKVASSIIHLSQHAVLLASIQCSFNGNRCKSSVKISIVEKYADVYCTTAHSLGYRSKTGFQYHSTPGLLSRPLLSSAGSMQELLFPVVVFPSFRLLNQARHCGEPCKHSRVLTASGCSERRMPCFFSLYLLYWKTPGRGGKTSGKLPVRAALFPAYPAT